MMNLWKYSRLRFYVKNFMWNFNFWFFSKKEYVDVTYFSKNFFNVASKTNERIKKRFKGYSYKGNIYLDNPGIPNIEKDVWDKWKQKGLIN